MPAKANLLNQKFGKLLVIKEVPKELRKSKNVEWYCQCDCGNTVQVRSHYLLSGHTQSCGCLRGETCKKQFTKNITNQRFGRLIAIEPTEDRYLDGSIIWRCQCDCGNQVFISTNLLLRGDVESCGCLRSRGEAKLVNLLTKNGVNFKRQYYFDDLKDKKYLYFDFAIFDDNNNLKLLLEYQGEQHYRDTTRGAWISPIQHDLMKREYCKNHGIPLIEISYLDFDNLDWEFLKSKLFN